MANEEHLALLKQGVEAWNRWRQEHPEVVHPDLKEADLSGADLRGADLRRADLGKANLVGANLHGAYRERARMPLTSVMGMKRRPASILTRTTRGGTLCCIEKTFKGPVPCLQKHGICPSAVVGADGITCTTMGEIAI